MPTEFSALLARLRRKRGYKTPYAFFTRNGGRHGLGMSYGAYWKIEKGKILPQGGRLSVLLTCLGLAPKSPDAREFLRSYLKACLGSEQVLDWILDAFGPGAAAEPSIGEKAMERFLHENLYRLTPKQNQAVLSDYAAYWAYEVLTTDERPRRVADLARELGVSPVRLKASLKRLAANRLVKLGPDSTVFSPLACRHIHMVPETSWTQAGRDRIGDFQARLAKERGTRVARAYVVARAQAGELSSYVPHLRKAVCEFLAHSSRERTPSNSLFLIEGSVHRLLP